MRNYKNMIRTVIVFVNCFLFRTILNKMFENYGAMKNEKII